MIKHSIFFLLTSLTVSACSTKGFYETLQPSLSSCQEITISQREECTESVNSLMTYDEYTKAREKLIH